MNCKQAKEQISLNNHLAKLGIIPVRETKTGTWFLSPLHEEKTASFKVFPNDRSFIDFGFNCYKGTIIDLVMIMNETNIEGALEIINNSYAHLDLPPPSPAKRIIAVERGNESKISVTSVRKIITDELCKYIESRKININTAQAYLVEVTYQVNKGKDRTSIAIKTDAGGYEIRNELFKVNDTKIPKYWTCGNKSITTIHKPKSNQLNIFEGYFDFLSALEYYKLQRPTHTTIILNSLSNLKAVFPLLSAYDKINIFLDNDLESKAGQKAALEISKRHPYTINHAAIIYPGAKDFSDFLTGKIMSKN